MERGFTVVLGWRREVRGVFIVLTFMALLTDNFVLLRVGVESSRLLREDLNGSFGKSVRYPYHRIFE